MYRKSLITNIGYKGNPIQKTLHPAPQNNQLIIYHKMCLFLTSQKSDSNVGYPCSLLWIFEIPGFWGATPPEEGVVLHVEQPPLSFRAQNP